MRGPGANKYSAVRTAVDGVTFASKAEALRYWQLKLLKGARAITDLELQPRFDLFVQRANSNKHINCGFYKADFAYVQDGKRIVEDVKGRDTPLSALKRKLVFAIYGVEIQLVTGKGAPITKKGRRRVNGNPAHAPTIQP